MSLVSSVHTPIHQALRVVDSLVANADTHLIAGPEMDGIRQAMSQAEQSARMITDRPVSFELNKLTDAVADGSVTVRTASELVDRAVDTVLAKEYRPNVRYPLIDDVNNVEFRTLTSVPDDLAPSWMLGRTELFAEMVDRQRRGLIQILKHPEVKDSSDFAVRATQVASEPLIEKTNWMELGRLALYQMDNGPARLHDGAIDPKDILRNAINVVSGGFASYGDYGEAYIFVMPRPATQQAWLASASRLVADERPWDPGDWRLAGALLTAPDDVRPGNVKGFSEEKRTFLDPVKLAASETVGESARWAEPILKAYLRIETSDVVVDKQVWTKAMEELLDKIPAGLDSKDFEQLAVLLKTPPDLRPPQFADIPVLSADSIKALSSAAAYGENPDTLQLSTELLKMTGRFSDDMDMTNIYMDFLTRSPFGAERELTGYAEILGKVRESVSATDKSDEIVAELVESIVGRLDNAIGIIAKDVKSDGYRNFPDYADFGLIATDYELLKVFQEAT